MNNCLLTLGCDWSPGRLDERCHQTYAHADVGGESEPRGGSREVTVSLGVVLRSLADLRLFCDVPCELSEDSQHCQDNQAAMEKNQTCGAGPQQNLSRTAHSIWLVLGGDLVPLVFMSSCFQMPDMSAQSSQSTQD